MLSVVYDITFSLAHSDHIKRLLLCFKAPNFVSINEVIVDVVQVVALNDVVSVVYVTVLLMHLMLLQLLKLLY